VGTTAASGGAVVRSRRRATRVIAAALAAALALVAGAAHADAQQPPIETPFDDRSAGARAEPSETDPSAGADDQDADTFLDRDGHTRPFRPSYEAWFGAGRRPPRYLRAAVEGAIIMGLGTAYYWADPLANSEDWDDPLLIDKLTGRQARFDTNLNTTNHLLHPGAGALVYGFSRVNGLSVPAALAYKAASSFLWEFVLEWREQASINDLFFTTVGGVPVGEFFVKLGDYVNSAPGGGGLGHKIAARTVGLPRYAHARIDGEADAPPLATDALGFSSAFGHAFRVAYQPAHLTNDLGASGALHRAAIDGEMIAMPGFLRPGSFEHPFAEGNFSDLHVKVGWGDHGTDEVDIDSTVTLAGYYAQSFAAADDGGAPEGHAAMIGIGPGWRFHATKLLGRRDQLSTVNVLGPHAGWWTSSGPFYARVLGNVHVDFASIRSLAFDSDRDRYPEDSLKSVLLRQGYAYHFGWSARARTQVGLGPLELAFDLRYGRYDSIDALDRFQEELVRDVPGSEQVLEGNAWLFFRPLSVLEIGAGVLERRRWSALGRIQHQRWDRALMGSVGIAF
jgi:hypothetical protein